jgi:hypothetical protein
MVGSREEGWRECILVMAFLAIVTVSGIRKLTFVNIPVTGITGEALHSIHHHLCTVRFVAVCTGHRPMMFLQRKPAGGVLRHPERGRLETVYSVTANAVALRTFRVKLSPVRIAGVTITALLKCNRQGKIRAQMTPYAFNSSVPAQERVPGL